MKEACIEIQNENLSNWYKRRKLENEKREKIDVVETENWERTKRKNICNEKKKKTTEHLMKKGLLGREKPSKEWLKEKTAFVEFRKFT